MDEKQDIRVSTGSMSSGDSGSDLEHAEESHELLNKDEREAQDLEAQSPVEPSLPAAAPVEYSVSTSRKLFFLGLYFLLNLAVTLSNKALLRMVNYTFGMLHVSQANPAQGIISVVIDIRPHLCYFNRMHSTACDWPPQAIQAYCSRELGSDCFLHIVHPQYCDFECFIVSATDYS